MMELFHIENIAFEYCGYPVSYIEAIGTLFGLASVYLASRANIFTWATGIANEICLGVLFFQVQLYADVFLQFYFLTVTLYGWYNWKKTGTKPQQKKMKGNTYYWLFAGIIGFTIISGAIVARLHLFLPAYFRIPAAYPFVDSFILVASIVATVLLAQKKIENWYLWIIVDLVCVILYYQKGIYFLSLEYFVFLGIAGYGWYHWKPKRIHD